MNRFIHLLYVPTMNCNMQCKYCYLGENTVDSAVENALETLEYAVEKFRQSGVVPFNISLHGGEVTTLGRQEFRSVVEFIAKYYESNRELLLEQGFKVGHPHIKTNLLDLDKHIDTIREFNVSVSGSLDLPFSLHREYRVTKGGRETLSKILSNVALLESLPNRKKVSATVFREHFEKIDEMIEDIRYLHANTCLDMNDFNFMIGFASDRSGCVQLTPLSEEEQVALFRRMNKEFNGTDLQHGLDNSWFAEFTQSYCTSCDLCGEKFFLLERNGDIYSCVRGQGNPDFYYGNIYKNSVEEILGSGAGQIFKAHNSVGFDEQCAECGHLHLCKTGCPYVKKVYGSAKSYTCLLQKEIYRKNNEPEETQAYPYEYLIKVHPMIADKYYSKPFEENSLPDLISKDKALQKIYDTQAFVLCCNGEEYRLESQILKDKRDFVFLDNASEMILYVREDVMDALADYPVNNSLYMMLLSGDTVVYGDEQRSKQEHIMTHQIFRRTVAAEESDREGYFRVDLMPVLRPYFKYLPQDKPNNLFFTTSAFRDYHYSKQKNNGFYHIAALNLPFQNIEFYYMDIEEE